MSLITDTCGSLITFLSIYCSLREQRVNNLVSSQLQEARTVQPRPPRLLHHHSIHHSQKMHSDCWHWQQSMDPTHQLCLAPTTSKMYIGRFRIIQGVCLGRRSYMQKTAPMGETLVVYARRRPQLCLHLGHPSTAQALWNSLRTIIGH